MIMSVCAFSGNDFIDKSVCLMSRIYKGIANQTAKNNYRPDLRGPAVSRASAIQSSQKAKKETPEKKLRGAKARKAEKP
jgi:large subunit ribosomal protein L28e